MPIIMNKFRMVVQIVFTKLVDYFKKAIGGFIHDPL